MEERQKYHLISGYVLSKENMAEITNLIPSASIGWMGEKREIEEKIRLRGKFSYSLECLREPGSEAVRYIETRMLLRLVPVLKADLGSLTLKECHDPALPQKSKFEEIH
jgi:hypothetical protein